MALQDLTPINDQLADIIVRADEPWIETEPGKAWMKVLWTGPETGRWVALIKEGVFSEQAIYPISRIFRADMIFSNVDLTSP